MTRLLTIMGSGETAPTMIKVHRDLIGRLGSAPRAVLLDTPYGFQENAPELATRAQDYFDRSVGHPIEVAGLTRFGDDTLTIEQGLARVRAADYVFAGPGSPTYALRQWAGTPLPALLADKLRTGGAVTFASAAALTLGVATVPVYEIYKVGDDPHWLSGLDLLAALELPVAVIPHYDNAEGGHHDTRFCYLGERRLQLLEASLPAGVHVLGVDEHTGLVCDLDADTATVVGNGVVTVRVQGVSTIYRAGATVPIDALRSPDRAAAVAPNRPGPDAGEPPRTDGDTRPSLAADAARLEREFDDAIDRRDASAAARATLELEQAIRAWSADTLTGTDNDTAVATLRSMIVRLGDAAVRGVSDPRDLVAPYVEVLVELRNTVRADERYDLSDLIRDRLAAAGVELRDTPDGAEWHLVDATNPA
jgi:peptidase E